MSDIDNLVETLTRRLQRNGIEPIKEEIAAAQSEIEGIRQSIAQSFEQDFKYDNVTPCTRQLRSACYELGALGKFYGEFEMLLNNYVAKLRSA